MKKEIIATGRSVEEALEKAVLELGAPNVEAIEYTVIEAPKKGFLGFGAAPAKINASYTVKGADIALEFIRNLV